MKKTVMTCVAVIAVLAIAGTAGAITCTVDQRPAATLLVPYFQVSYDASGALVSSGVGARDTIVTIANASSAPTIAHVSVFDRTSVLRLDFDVALTGGDVQAMRMSDILAGHLPVYAGDEVCQRACSTSQGCPPVYPEPGGFLRVIPLSPTASTDNVATVKYNDPAFGAGFSTTLIHNLRVDCDDVEGDLATGYITVDMVNYCNLSNPSNPDYFIHNAPGMENNLWGEIVFTSGFGLPTYAMAPVSIEADSSFGFDDLSTVTPVRTFYARYWNAGDNTGGGNNIPLSATCLNCGTCTGGAGDVNFLNCNAQWDVGYGDQREPLGLKYAARWFDLTSSGIITTNYRIWRGGENNTTYCDTSSSAVPLPQATALFLDEDENQIGSGGGVCSPFPCGPPPEVGLLLETQQVNITSPFFSHPTANAGWVQFSFAQASGTPFDQAWVDYSFEGSIALESVLVPGTQLDPSTCNPLGNTPTFDVIPVIPTVPSGTGS